MIKFDWVSVKPEVKYQLYVFLGKSKALIATVRYAYGIHRLYWGDSNEQAITPPGLGMTQESLMTFAEAEVARLVLNADKNRVGGV